MCETLYACFTSAYCSPLASWCRAPLAFVKFRQHARFLESSMFMEILDMRSSEGVWQDVEPRSDAAGSAAIGKGARDVVCTLAEGSYFHGAAALTNSLVRAGFEGSVVVGYRGSKPPWLGALDKDPTSNAYLVTSKVRLQFIEVPGTWHLANYKAHLIKQIFHKIVSDADLVYYFDTDIVIKYSWKIFAAWARHGVVLALDVANSYMSPHHVYRRAWQTLAARQARQCRDFTGYANSGCVGISRAYTEFAEVWSALMEELERDGTDMTKMKNFTDRPEFSRMDQDVMNATIMATDIPIALLGFEAMGLFPGGGTVMPHAIFHEKPWVRKYILDALRGFPPGRTHLAYWEFVDAPIRSFSEWEIKRKKTAVAIARLIGLLHSRSYRDL